MPSVVPTTPVPATVVAPPVVPTVEPRPPRSRPQRRPRRPPRPLRARRSSAGAVPAAPTTNANGGAVRRAPPRADSDRDAQRDPERGSGGGGRQDRTCPPTRGYVVVDAPASHAVYNGGVFIGLTGQKLELECGIKYLRLGAPPENGVARPNSIVWTSEGKSANVVCKAVTHVTPITTRK